MTLADMSLPQAVRLGGFLRWKAHALMREQAWARSLPCWGADEEQSLALSVKTFIFLLQNSQTPERDWNFLDDRQMTHLICVRLKHLLYDFLGGVLGLLPVVFLYKGPKHPQKKSYSKCSRRTQIRWVIWRSSSFWRVSEGVSEGFLKGPSYLSAEGLFKTSWKRLQEPFKNLSRRRWNRWCVRLPGLRRGRPPKEAQKPPTPKSARESARRGAGQKRGAREVRGKVLVLVVARRETRRMSTFPSTSPSTPFLAGTSPSTLLSTFGGLGVLRFCPLLNFREAYNQFQGLGIL